VTEQPEETLLEDDNEPEDPLDSEYQEPLERQDRDGLEKPETDKHPEE
jgi:hypothetical protein